MMKVVITSGFYEISKDLRMRDSTYLMRFLEMKV